MLGSRRFTKAVHLGDRSKDIYQRIAAHSSPPQAVVALSLASGPPRVCQRALHAGPLCGDVRAYSARWYILLEVYGMTYSILKSM